MIIYLFVALAVLASVQTVLLVLVMQTAERARRAGARERDLLVNQILHLSGRTWTPPPADEWQPPRDGEPLVREWTATPEQHPYQV